LTRTELIALVAEAFPEFRHVQIQKAVSKIFEGIIRSVNEGNRVEFRGFGIFFVSFRKPRLGRNPKTGEAVEVPAKRKLSFRVGMNLREKMNPNLEEQSLQGAEKSKLPGRKGTPQLKPRIK
jgi:integration host factor subunit beta